MELTPTHLGIYLFAGIGLIAGLATLFAALEKRAHVRCAEGDFLDQLRKLPAGCILDQQRLSEMAGQGSASADVLLQMVQSPKLVLDDLAADGYCHQALEKAIGPVSRASHFIAHVAPSIGLLGTVLGFAMGALEMSGGNPSPQRFFASLCLALGVTLISLVTLILQTVVVHTVIAPLRSFLVGRLPVAVAEGRRILSSPETAKPITAAPSDEKEIPVDAHSS